MSAPYPTEEKKPYPDQAPYPTTAPPTYDASAYPPAQPMGQQQGFPQQQGFQQQPYQPQGYPQGASSNTVIVTQPHAPVVTYPIAQRSPYTGCAIGALVLSIGACCCTCWPIGLIALILAIIALASEGSPETQRNLSIASYVISAVAIVVGVAVFIWWFNVREDDDDSYSYERRY